MTDKWERLSLYESRDLLARFYRNKHGGNLSAGKAYEIIAHLSQGRGFFMSAQQSSELVRPLLVYYGVYALSRGLILFLDARMREASLPPSHGIEAEGWQHALAGGIDKLPDLPLKITGGTFAALSGVTGNVERFIIQLAPMLGPKVTPLPYPLLRPGTTTIKTPVTLTIKMVLELLSDLSTIFTTTFGNSSKCYQAVVTLHPEVACTDIRIVETELGMVDFSDIRSDISLPADVELVKTRMGEDPIGKNTLIRIRHSSKSELVEKLPPIKNDRDGNMYVVGLLPDDLDFSSLSLMYLISYSMGMLARYYPSKWLSLLNSSLGDFAFPLMKAAITVVEERFPQLVLQELEPI